MCLYKIRSPKNILLSLLFMRFGGSENLNFFRHAITKKNRLRQAPVTMLDGGAFDGAKAPTPGWMQGGREP